MVSNRQDLTPNQFLKALRSPKHSNHRTPPASHLGKNLTISLNHPTHKWLFPGSRTELVTRTSKGDRPSLAAETSSPERKKRFAWCVRMNWLAANRCAYERVPTPLDPQSPHSACPALGGAVAPAFGQMFLLFFSRSCHTPWNSPIPFMILKTERPRRPIRLGAASELPSPAHRPLLGHLIKCRESVSGHRESQ